MNKKERNDKIKSLYLEGFSMAKIGLEFGLDPSTVYQVIKKAGISRPSFNSLSYLTTERFLSKTTVANNGCREWQGTLDRDGYGKLNHNGVKMPAHRFAYQRFVGDIPEGLLVCHKCDNRKCCNPEHLFLGTAKDNANDMVFKNRQRKGATHPNFKSDENAISKVLALKSEGKTNSFIAKTLGVSRSSIGNWLRSRVDV